MTANASYKEDIDQSPDRSRLMFREGAIHRRGHPECNNRFRDETHFRKALQLLGALYDSNTTRVRPAPGNLNGRVMALNDENLPGFGPRDFQFFGFHDARNDTMANFDDPKYYADKPRADVRKTVLCTTLSVLAKSAAALLASRHLADLPSNWNIVCVPYAGDATGADLSSFFRETRPFATDIRVWTKRFEASSWVSIYATGKGDGHRRGRDGAAIAVAVAVR